MVMKYLVDVVIRTDDWEIIFVKELSIAYPTSCELTQPSIIKVCLNQIHGTHIRTADDIRRGRCWMECRVESIQQSAVGKFQDNAHIEDAPADSHIFGQGVFCYPGSSRFSGNKYDPPWMKIKWCQVEDARSLIERDLYRCIAQAVDMVLTFKGIYLLVWVSTWRRICFACLSPKDAWFAKWRCQFSVGFSRYERKRVQYPFYGSVQGKDFIMVLYSTF